MHALGRPGHQENLLCDLHRSRRKDGVSTRLREGPGVVVQRAHRRITRRREQISQSGRP